ncbi:MAG TPA: phosphoribosylformylglycinamidine synthase, partial [Candidatus Gemmiger faecigallinarum]|nr:phosphoribosylformylglycinamidine synthase [Candidatus Gemmiger faecigallinarum]
EPFGGAATCIGGAIRDPLSGRSYVYQAMRVTGAGNPLQPVSETMEGKLPQRKIVTTAAAGYSSYGNQIGLATGQVSELYHPGYVAKRMEIGAVVGATPASHVRRETPAPGDVIILLGGRTGRDGIGGATGSSKAHKLSSLETCGAEVQKGNAPIERKLQRLFRREDACRMIKRCNDFGAGGVSVAIGELADGLSIDLNKVTKKYEGLDGTELAISESQERMAVAVAAKDADTFIALANQENLEATIVATVTEEKRMKEFWNGKAIVDLSREFLSSNGAERHADAHILPGRVWQPQWAGSTFEEKLESLVTDLNVCSQKGLGERFDSTIGASTVLMPYGGKYQLTPTMAMVAKLPVDGETTTCSGMAWGFNPYLTEADPYRGAFMAVVESVTKMVCAGFRHKDLYLTFQEYFEHMGAQPERWGKPLAALLGALDAQMGLGIASIGGKDSMSGSFEGLDVPPTLVSFATAIGDTRSVVSAEFKKANSAVVILKPQYKDGLPTVASLLSIYKTVEQMIDEGKVLAAATPGYGGVAEALFKMCVGNHVGLRLSDKVDMQALFRPCYGAVILELLDASAGEFLGFTTVEYTLTAGGQDADMERLQDLWEGKLEPVFPYRRAGSAVEALAYDCKSRVAPAVRLATPKVVIPVFPGTNCEYDTARAFRRAGADPQVLVLKNLTPADVAESCEALVKAIDEAQILMLPGGFSGGDEPDGSAKFITAFFRAPAVADAVNRLLNQRDGLALGICNGFQALIKLGLVPYGEIRPITDSDPTLTFNTVGRHQSMLVRTRVASNKSPWLSECSVNDEHLIAISHGEGRFVCNDALLNQLIANGQVATQYVDLTCTPTMDQRYNPNGSVLAIEGITSPDGRVLGKMGHSERSGDELYKNVGGDKYQPLFEGGVNYFKL